MDPRLREDEEKKEHSQDFCKLWQFFISSDTLKILGQDLWETV